MTKEGDQGRVRRLALPIGAKCVLITDEGDHWRVWLGINKIDAPIGKRYGTFIELWSDGSAYTVTIRPDGGEEQQVMERR